MQAIDIRRAAERFHTHLGWLDSHHSFSFGHHHDPTNVGHGLLIVSNDDVVGPGGGFAPHSHRDMEIVTWVLDGELEHRDSAGHHGIIGPGMAQRMSAGSGVTHSEMNHSATASVHFVQMWVPPDTVGLTPSYEQRDATDALGSGELIEIASGRDGRGLVSLHQRDAAMWVARTRAGRAVELPSARFVHVFVARGTAELGDTVLHAGDAARLNDTTQNTVTVVEDAEILVWESNQEAQR